MRSVPLTWSARVINAAPPNARTAAAMRSSSVATITACTRDAAAARRYTCSIIGWPAMSARIFPGRRVELEPRGDDGEDRRFSQREWQTLDRIGVHDEVIPQRYCGDPAHAARDFRRRDCVSCSPESEMAVDPHHAVGRPDGGQRRSQPDGSARSLTHDPAARAVAAQLDHHAIRWTSAPVPHAEKLRQRLAEPPLPSRGRNPFVYGCAHRDWSAITSCTAMKRRGRGAAGDAARAAGAGLQVVRDCVEHRERRRRVDGHPHRQRQRWCSRRRAISCRTATASSASTNSR